MWARRVVRHIFAPPHVRLLSSKTQQPVDVAALLEKPAWSIRTLLSPSESSIPTQSISATELEHLSKLSALPMPQDPTASLKALQAHLHFVSVVRGAPTDGVPPLQSLRDETKAGEQATKFGMQELHAALKGEAVVGKFHKRIRRRRQDRQQEHDSQARDAHSNSGADWDVLGLASRKVGRYFVVDREVTGQAEDGG